MLSIAETVEVAVAEVLAVVDETGGTVTVVELTALETSSLLDFHVPGLKMSKTFPPRRVTKIAKA